MQLELSVPYFIKMNVAQEHAIKIVVAAILDSVLRFMSRKDMT